MAVPAFVLGAMADMGALLDVLAHNLID